MIIFSKHFREPCYLARPLPFYTRATRLRSDFSIAALIRVHLGTKRKENIRDFINEVRDARRLATWLILIFCEAHRVVGARREEGGTLIVASPPFWCTRAQNWAYAFGYPSLDNTERMIQVECPVH